MLPFYDATALKVRFQALSLKLGHTCSGNMSASGDSGSDVSFGGGGTGTGGAVAAGAGAGAGARAGAGAGAGAKEVGTCV